MSPKKPDYCLEQSRVAEAWGGNKTDIPCTFDICEKGLFKRVCQFAIRQESPNQSQASLDVPIIIEPTEQIDAKK